MRAASPRHYADADLGQRERGSFRGDAEAAGERDLQPPAEREAVQGGYRGDLEPGEPVLRVISCIVNEAFLTLSEGVATAEDIDRAMNLGTNYPKGPFEWADEIGADRILDTLDSALLRRRATERWAPN